MRHLLTLRDVTAEEIERIFEISVDLKTKLQAGVREPLLPGRMLALLFQKPSLRTRVSFESAMTHLGGGSLFMGGDDVSIGKRETVEDFSRVLSQYVDVIVCRLFGHDLAAEIAKHATCPVINGLTDEYHPCQALADLLTMREQFGDLSGRTLAYIGDGNNVANSLALACAHLGVRFTIASPKGYEIDDKIVAEVKSQGAQIEVTNDPTVAVADASAIYTDVWASMGQEKEKQKRLADFADYQVTSELMKLAEKDACFLHCLPAHRGEEVAAEVIDGKQSAVIQQAGNRMHVQKGLIAWLLEAM